MTNVISFERKTPNAIGFDDKQSSFYIEEIIGDVGDYRITLFRDVRSEIGDAYKVIMSRLDNTDAKCVASILSEQISYEAAISMCEAVIVSLEFALKTSRGV